MHSKQSEEEFRTMMKRHGIWWHKFKDLWFCKFCHREQYKDDSMPDYMVVLDGNAYLVECKQSERYWNFADEKGAGIRTIQRQALDQWEAEHNFCFLFIVLGDGRAPKYRSAWLIPWMKWKPIEKELAEQGQRSLLRETKRNKGALELLKEWQVTWEEGGWTIPEGHDFWRLTGGINHAKWQKCCGPNRPEQIGFAEMV